MPIKTEWGLENIVACSQHHVASSNPSTLGPSKPAGGQGKPPEGQGKPPGGQGKPPGGQGKPPGGQGKPPGGQTPSGEFNEMTKITYIHFIDAP